jgi:hypothetical protein
VQGHELAAVRERRLDLHLRDELGHAFHHVLPREHVPPRGHQVRHRAPLSRPLDHPAGQQRDSLRLVELDAALTPVAGDHPSDREQQLGLIRRRQQHGDAR